MSVLHQLEIENYAVIEKLRVSFHPGLNVLTGETGSGKSILVDAFSLLLGARASAELIRSGAGRARVTGVFELALAPALQAALSEAGVELDPDELIVEREVLANGKTRAYLNSRLVTASVLRRIAPALGDCLNSFGLRAQISVGLPVSSHVVPYELDTGRTA